MCKDAAQPRFPQQDVQHTEWTQTFTLAMLIYYGANRAPVTRLPSENAIYTVSKNSLMELLGILGELGKPFQLKKSSTNTCRVSLKTEDFSFSKDQPISLKSRWSDSSEANQPQPANFTRAFGYLFHQPQMFVNPHGFLNALPCSPLKKSTLNQLLSNTPAIPHVCFVTDRIFWSEKRTYRGPLWREGCAT